MYRSLAIGIASLLATSGVASADLLWGVNGHPLNAYPGVSIERQLNYLKDLGMKSYRVNISDLDAADDLAALVSAGKQRGIEILPVITPGHIDLDKDSTGELFEKARALASGLGSRFKADIRVWELGNEMENYAIIKPCEKRDDGSQYPCAWGPAAGVDARDYYGPRWVKVSAVLKGLSTGMTEADPTIRKAMGTAGWGHTGAFERMQQDGIKWDITVWHMYGEDPVWAFEKLARYNLPIWVTEFNNPYGSQRGDKQQADGLKQTMVRLRELQGKYRIEAAHIYELLDETYWAPDFEAYMGLVRLTGSAESGWKVGEAKPAYGVVRELIRGIRPPFLPGRVCDLKSVQAANPIPVRQVRFGYCLMLGRGNGGAELEQWAGDLENGKASYVDMLMSILRSDEFNDRYETLAMSDRAYVGFLYQLLVGRQGDTYGVDSYVQQLQSGAMTREAIALGMMTSSEFADRYATQLGVDHDARAAGTQPPG